MGARPYVSIPQAQTPKRGIEDPETAKSDRLLAQLLGNYGMTSGATYEDGDLDGDGDVDLADLAALLGVYGTTCP